MLSALLANVFSTKHHVFSSITLIFYVFFIVESGMRKKVWLLTCVLEGASCNGPNWWY